MISIESIVYLINYWQIIYQWIYFTSSKIRNPFLLLTLFSSKWEEHVPLTPLIVNTKAKISIMTCINIFIKIIIQTLALKLKHPANSLVPESTKKHLNKNKKLSLDYQSSMNIPILMSISKYATYNHLSPELYWIFKYPTNTLGSSNLELSISNMLWLTNLPKSIQW